MKKLLFAFCLGASGALFALPGYAPVSTIEGIHTLGYSEIDSRLAYLPLGIPYNEASPNHDVKITVADVVMTATLAVGDELYAYDRDTKHYNVYTLVQDASSKRWQPNGVKEITREGSASADTLPPEQVGLLTGYGFWLHRLGESTNSIVQVMGQLATNAVVTVNGGDYALLGSIGSQPIDLTASDDTNPFADKAVLGDTIEIPQNFDGSLTLYRYTTAGWKSLKRNTPLAPIASGTAFWYLRAKDAEPLTITWEF